MGLDNGIIIRHITGEEEDLCYWRKCWNIRALFFSVVPSQTDEYKYIINKEELLLFYKLLKKLNRKNWEDSIWSWEEYKHQLRKQKRAIKKFLKKWETDDTIDEVYFYDSY